MAQPRSLNINTIVLATPQPFETHIGNFLSKQGISKQSSAHPLKIQ